MGVPDPEQGQLEVAAVQAVRYLASANPFERLRGVRAAWALLDPVGPFVVGAVKAARRQPGATWASVDDALGLEAGAARARYKKHVGAVKRGRPRTHP